MIKLNFSATMYGNGVYFARDASYSTQSKYSPPDGNGNRYMYLARVLVGEYAAGRQGMITPPAKGSDATDAYDSVVDSPGNPVRSNVEWRRRKIRVWEPTFYEVCQKKVLVFWVVIGKLAQVGS